MGRPRLIILVRHAQSEGNKNRDIHQTIPDHRVKLTQDGWQQAYDAGRRLRALLREDDTLHFFTSPYRRTRETTEGILATLTSDEPATSPFQRDNIKVYEEPRLREQDFGNFQPCSAEMERMWQERADYGHFFYRIPNGESAADAYDRVSGFNESLWRQFGEDDFASVCVLVTHGLMSRVFLMKWYHFSVEHFEDLRNVNHCEFLIMRRNDDSGKYILENNLRTWSGLKRERALEQAEKAGKPNGKAGKEHGKSKDAFTLARAGTFEVRRRWGGCPNGCDHDKSFKIRQTLADLVKSDSLISNHAVGLAAVNEEPSPTASVPAVSDSDSGTPTHSSHAGTPGSTHGIVNPSFNGTGNSHTLLVSRRPAAKRFLTGTTDGDGDYEPDNVTGGPQIDVTKARDEVVSSPDGTPSYISVDDRLRSRIKSPNVPPRPLQPVPLHVGRDFGGSYSGHDSAGSDDADDSEGDYSDRHRPGAAPLTPSSTSTTASTTINITTNITVSADPVSDHEEPSSDSPTATPTQQKQKAGLGIPTSAIPLHHRPHNHTHYHHHKQHRHEREQSRMGRGTRANRLGDHHSSDGEHEADCEGEKKGAVTTTRGNSSSSVAVNKLAVCEHGHDDDDSGSDEVTREMTDEADEVLAREEREDRSLRGSVY
ncbi:histidine phosphatase superfamily [Dichotomopilus funicola]|uniref:Histidine phosphatase superfamily n=1 Tax=Dichotomopilus funicola TaxID=1934379 RepID=A0AAN6UUB0_9PEZI|nr:histidine phosphatase superfamily [Dichotomopilus funicola]